MADIRTSGLIDDFQRGPGSIVRDEEQMIEACLRSVKPLVSQFGRAERVG